MHLSDITPMARAKIRVTPYQKIQALHQKQKTNIKTQENKVNQDCKLPIRHNTNGFKSQDKGSIGIRATILPTAQRGSQEIAGSSIGFRDHSG